MMDDLINRQTAIDALCKMRCGCVLSSCPLTLEEDGTEECADVRFLMDLPSAQRKGKWEGHFLGESKFQWGYNCTNCGEWFVIGKDYIKRYRHCPNCGAEMLKGEEDVRKSD